MKEEQLHRIAKALADPTRFAILERIGGTPETACATLATDLPVSQATISHHLKELTTAGLLERQREAKFGYYRLREDAWERYLKELRKRVPTGK